MKHIELDDLLGPRLDAHDTCDRCGPGTQAYAAVRLPSGKILTFCNHHLRLYAKALTEQGATATTTRPVPVKEGC